MKYDKKTRALYFLAVLVALTLMLLLLFRYLGSARQLTDLQQQLADSRHVWESISEEKENLQADLKDVSNQIREATLTLEESEARAAELKDEVRALEADIRELEGKQKMK